MRARPPKKEAMTARASDRREVAAVDATSVHWNTNGGSTVMKVAKP
jgi:hypothetical protein